MIVADKIKIHTEKNKKFGLDEGSPQLSENRSREYREEISSVVAEIAKKEEKFLNQKIDARAEFR